MYTSFATKALRFIVVLSPETAEIYEDFGDNLVCVGKFKSADGAFGVESMDGEEYVVLYRRDAASTVLGIRWDEDTEMHEVQENELRLVYRGSGLHHDQAPVFRVFRIKNGY